MILIPETEVIINGEGHFGCVGIHFPLCTASVKKSRREMSTSAELLGKKVMLGGAHHTPHPTAQMVAVSLGLPSNQEVEGQLKGGVLTVLLTWPSCTLLDYYKGQCLGKRMECELLARDRTRLGTLKTSWEMMSFPIQK